MNANEKARWAAIPPVAAPPSFKLKPAARRQYLLQVIRGRVPRDRCSSKNAITASHSSFVPRPVAPEIEEVRPAEA